MLRLGVGERGVTEVMAVAEHTASLCAGAAALQVTAETEESGPHPEGSEAVLGEIRNWAEESLGLGHPPTFWVRLAGQPRLLAATWRKDRMVMEAGRLDRGAKACVALAVAAFRQSDYWVTAFRRLASREAGLDEHGLTELAGCVMHYVSFNTIAHGMRLKADAEEMTSGDVR